MLNTKTIKVLGYGPNWVGKVGHFSRETGYNNSSFVLFTCEHEASLENSAFVVVCSATAPTRCGWCHHKGEVDVE